MAMQALRESAKTLRIGMIAGDGIGRNVLPVRRPLMPPSAVRSPY